MGFKRVLLGGAIAAVVALGAASAGASISTVTYKGHVSRGSDVTGVFGVAGLDLTGAAYTSVYRINDAVAHTTVNSPGIYSILYGGTSYGFPTSFEGGQITINGVTDVVDPLELGEHFQSKIDYGYSQIFDEVYDHPVTAELYIERLIVNRIINLVTPVASTSDWHGPLTYTAMPGDTADGAFRDLTYDFASGVYTTLVDVDLVTDSVTISSTPEPAAWALMIGGFGLAGAALRRRRSAAATQG